MVRIYMLVNPFQYGGVVGPEAFCNHQQEVHDLTRAVENRDRLFVYAERRLGKTSLVRTVLQGLDRKLFLPVYVDLWPTDGAESFATATAKALAEATATRAEKLLETSKELFSRLRPSLTLDEAGNPSLQFGARTGDEREPVLEEVLAAPPKAAQKRNRRVVMVYDEFQQLMTYENNRVERALRAAVQQQAEVAYLFLGSRKHLIEQMFTSERRPLFRSAGHYPLGPIATVHWEPFIRERFEQVDKPISGEQIEALCRLTEGHPFSTVSGAFWRAALSGFEPETP